MHDKEFRNQKSSQLPKVLFYYITVWDMTAQRIQKSEIFSAAKADNLLHKSLRYNTTTYITWGLPDTFNKPMAHKTCQSCPHYHLTCLKSLVCN